MSDLVERLRGTREWVGFPAVPICAEAADEIEQMRGLLDKWHTKAADLATENERLRDILKEIMKVAEATGGPIHLCGILGAKVLRALALEPPTH